VILDPNDIRVMQSIKSDDLCIEATTPISVLQSLEHECPVVCAVSAFNEKGTSLPALTQRFQDCPPIHITILQLYGILFGRRVSA
jgi:hypothetical protein